MWIWKTPKCSVFKELFYFVVSLKTFGMYLAFQSRLWFSKLWRIRRKSEGVWIKGYFSPLYFNKKPICNSSCSFFAWVFNKPLSRTETPTCSVAPRSRHIHVSSIALSLLTSQGLGTCQREQSKPDGLEHLMSGPQISQKQIQKSLIVLILTFRVAFILTSVLDLPEHSIGNLWSQTRIFFVLWGVLVRQHAHSWTPCGWITLSELPVVEPSRKNFN